MKLLIIEDEKSCAEVMAACLKEMFSEVVGFQIRIAPTLEEGRVAWIEMQPHIVFLDLTFPDSTGLATVESIREFKVRSDVIIISYNRDLHDECFRAGAHDFLDKRMMFDRERGYYKLLDFKSRIASAYYRALYGCQSNN